MVINGLLSCTLEWERGLGPFSGWVRWDRCVACCLECLVGSCSLGGVDSDHFTSRHSATLHWFMILDWSTQRVHLTGPPRVSSRHLTLSYYTRLCSVLFGSCSGVQHLHGDLLNVSALFCSLIFSFPSLPFPLLRITFTLHASPFTFTFTWTLPFWTRPCVDFAMCLFPFFVWIRVLLVGRNMQCVCNNDTLHGTVKGMCFRLCCGDHVGSKSLITPTRWLSFFVTVKEDSGRRCYCFRGFHIFACVPSLFFSNRVVATKGEKS